MMTNEQQTAIIETLLNEIPHCRFVSVYGFCLSVHATQTSTIELALCANHPIEEQVLKQLQHNISERIQRHVSLVDLARCSQVVGYQVLTDGMCIYCAEGINRFERDPISLYNELRRPSDEQNSIPSFNTLNSNIANK